jgi:3D (Asp-Asp-Asp) domain-containing protein
VNFLAIIVIVACITVAEPIEASKPDWQAFEATAYTANCAGCTGITKTGIDVRETIYHEGKRIIAVDPRVIPLGSTVEIRLPDGTTFEALAEDVGGAIKGARIDVLVADKKTALAFGRQNVELRIISREGEEMKDQTEIIANLAARMYEVERRLSELEAKVGAHIRRIQALERSANDGVLKTGLVDYRIISRAPQAVRDEIVERAKTDVKELLDRNYPRSDGYNPSIWFSAKGGFTITDRCDFVINREKGTVVALIREIDGNVIYRGIAKCAPGDVFNAHIGKAIALRRALGLPVPGEYLNAPQPTEVRAGDIVRLCDGRLYKCKYNWPKLFAGETFFDDTRDGYEYKTEVTAE